jgi:sterol desaturase/sphingolipid hydroxylase (fatty acid hydroxylase superfamily)
MLCQQCEQEAVHKNNPLLILCATDRAASWESRNVGGVVKSKGISNAGNRFLILHVSSENTLHVYVSESVCEYRRAVDNQTLENGLKNITKLHIWKVGDYFFAVLAMLFLCEVELSPPSNTEFENMYDLISVPSWQDTYVMFIFTVISKYFPQQFVF